MPSLLSSAREQTPNHWSQPTPRESSSETHLIELHDTSPEYQNIMKLLLETKCTRRAGTSQDIFESLPRDMTPRIVRVENAYLWGCYLLKKEEYAKKRGGDNRVDLERKLWHSTTVNATEKIARDNFDWRRWILAVYGEGVNFSPTADYANWYANKKNPLERVLILSRVLVSQTKQVAGVPAWLANRSRGKPSRGSLPPIKYDTTRSYDCNVYVKYYDNEFYPEYLVYYTANKKRAKKGKVKKSKAAPTAPV